MRACDSGRHHTWELGREDLVCLPHKVPIEEPLPVSRVCTYLKASQLAAVLGSAPPPQNPISLLKRWRSSLYQPWQ